MALGVGERIKKRRIALGLSQTDLAKRMGYTNKTTISKVENGRDNITTDRVRKFADALHCSTSYLMGWEELEDNDIPEYDTKDAECLALFSKLTETQKDNILNLMRSM